MNIQTGQTIAFVRFEEAVQEIFAVQVLPGRRFPGPDQRQQRSVDFRFVCAARLGSGRGGRLVPGPGFGGPLRGLPDRQVDSSRAGQTAGIDIVICWPQHPRPRPRSRIEAAA